jgi:hypothetical protein
MTDTPVIDRPLTLAQAAELYGLTVATLRAEADRGRLVRFRIGRRDYTTHADMQAMIERCRAADSRRTSSWTAPDAHGASEMATASSAQAALRESVKALRNGSTSTSGTSTSPSHRRAH